MLILYNRLNNLVYIFQNIKQGKEVADKHVVELNDKDMEVLIIVLSVVGGVLLVTLIVVSIFCYHKNKKTKDASKNAMVSKGYLKQKTL